MTEVALKRRERALALGKPYGLSGAPEVVPLMQEGAEGIKGFSVICRRLGAAYFVRKLALALLEDEDNEVLCAQVRADAKVYSVDYDMTPREVALTHGDAGSRDLREMASLGEAMAVLVWILGGLPAPLDPTKPADVEAVARYVEQREQIQGLCERSRMGDTEEIADVIDLYRLYAKAGVGDERLVRGRRVALEWLVSGSNDWYRLKL